MSIESIKHKEKRAHIPSKEEAGYEDGNEKVQAKMKAAYLKNPIVHRGQDPELMWLNKYGQDNQEEIVKVDIRSLYRHEHISPELLIRQFYKLKEANPEQGNLFDLNALFGNALQYDELDKVGEYYQHQDGWSNRIIQGDSLLVMTSLLEREGISGKVQMIYIDPPYGIKYGSNWQMKLHDRNVKDGKDEHLSAQPEQIKAYRDTWELAIHSYLSYLRDRLLIAKELLTESGSCFVQISDENVHLVRCLMDEVFGSENFVSLITFRKTSAQTALMLPSVSDYLLWYGKDINQVKYRQLYTEKNIRDDSNYRYIEFPDGKRESFSHQIAYQKYKNNEGKLFRLDQVTSQTGTEKSRFEFSFEGKKFKPAGSRGWSTSKEGLERLVSVNRLVAPASILCYVRFLDDFPVTPTTNYWEDTGSGGFGEGKLYVVQTTPKSIQRCMLMTTDPGDLILDPTCGSGTSAYVAEQWGRRWITIDTSRIAINIAKSRLTTAAFPYYHLYDAQGKDIRQGFVYKRVPHITLKSLANDEPAAEETLYDQPKEDKKRLRISGPFTVETLQSFEPISPEELDRTKPAVEELENFEDRIFEHLKSAGVKNGIRNEHAIFSRVERLSSGYLHAEGFYESAEGEKKAYLYIGPKFGTVSKLAVNEAIKECRLRGDADWLIILGFSFESEISNQNVTTRLGSFEVTRTQMHDDLLQDGLLKKDRKAASFVTIGEPDIELHQDGNSAYLEIKGLDIYDPIKDQINARNVHDIAYWLVDDDYDGSNFIVKQLFFCGGKRDEFKKWQKGLDNMSKISTRRKAEKTLKIEIDEEAFDRVYSHKSHPIEIKREGQKIAVRVISQFGEESTKVLQV